MSLDHIHPNALQQLGTNAIDSNHNSDSEEEDIIDELLEVDELDDELDDYTSLTDTSKWPMWAKSWHEKFSEDGLGREWSDLVSRWAALEEQYLWENKRKRFPDRKRPPVIGKWIIEGRKNILLDAKSSNDVENFGQMICSWWLDINPTWRMRREDGMLFARGEGVGSWECLRKPGENGFLGILWALWWWRKLALQQDGNVISGWLDVVHDVTWAISCLSAEELSGKENGPSLSCRGRKRKVTKVDDAQSKRLNRKKIRHFSVTITT